MNAAFNEAPGATVVTIMAIVWLALLLVAPLFALF